MIDSNKAEVEQLEEVSEELVSKKAYTEVTQDMHKYKTRLKETEAMLNQIKAEKEEADRQSLLANEEYKALYEQAQSKLSEIEKIRHTEKEQFINHHKKNAVLRELGGFKKEEYTSFVNISNVEMDDEGNIIKDSLLSEVSRIKQEYPELIKSAQVNNLPSTAPKTFEPQAKSFKDLSEKERDALKEQLLRKQTK